MTTTGTITGVAAALMAALLLAGCSKAPQPHVDTLVPAGCTDSCATAPTDPMFATPVPVPTLDPALVAWRTMVHARVTALTTDLDAVTGCGGDNGDDRADCHRKIAALMTDARTMRSAVNAAPVPPDATDDAGKISDALDLLVQGCTHDDAALGSNSMFVWLPGSTTSQAFQQLLALDDGLRTS